MAYGETRGNEKVRVVQWILAAGGVLIAVGGSVAVWEVQGARTGASLWPLPALILMDWVLLGFVSFLGTYLGTDPGSSRWLGASWFAVGALVPLVVMGMLSIGLIMLLSLLAFFLGALLAAIVQEGRLYRYLGFLILGAVANLGLLVLIVLLSQPHL